MDSKEKKKKDEPSDHVSLKTKIGYGAFEAASLNNWFVNVWLLFYLTTFVGLSVGLATTVFAIGKVISAFFTPIYGYISDHLYRTAFGRKFGRRKAMLLVGLPLEAFFYIWLWVPNEPHIIYYVTYVFFIILQPALGSTKLTFMSEMTENSVQRAELAGANQYGSAVGTILASSLATFLFARLGQHNQMTFFLVALIFNAIYLIGMFIFYKSVYERKYDESTDLKAATNSSSLAGKGLKGLKEVVWNFGSVFRLKSFNLYMAMYITESMFRALWGDINTYFIVFVLLLDPNTVNVSTLVGFAFGIFCTTFFLWYTAKTDGPKSYRAGAYWTILNTLAILAIAIIRPAHLVIWFIVLQTLLNFGKAGVTNACQFIFTFMPDIDEIVTGKRREGQYSGVQIFIDTLFGSIILIIVGWVLDATGFQEKALTQPAGTRMAILIMYTAVPIILAILGVISSFLLKLDVPNHAIVLKEIHRLRAGGSMADVDPHTKAVVEKLTGFKYEDCWGNNTVMHSPKDIAQPVTHS